MGKRGEIWVLIQAVLLVSFIALPSDAVPWPYSKEFGIAGWICVALGLLLLSWSALNLGRSLTPFPRPTENGELITSGAYRIVRHPIYLGVLLTCLGFALATASSARLGMTLVLFVFFDMKARREELWLKERYPDYGLYQQRAKRLIPWLY
jgi:protein-S-isoprenylcysteine O-methyltransferase Ste14